MLDLVAGSLLVPTARCRYTRLAGRRVRSSFSLLAWARKIENRGPNRKNREPEPNRTEIGSWYSGTEVLGLVSVLKPTEKPKNRSQHTFSNESMNLTQGPTKTLT